MAADCYLNPDEVFDLYDIVWSSEIGCWFCSYQLTGPEVLYQPEMNGFSASGETRMRVVVTQDAFDLPLHWEVV